MPTAFPDRSFRQDPQSNLTLTVGEARCEVTFSVWDDKDQDVPGLQGVARFFDSWACEYVALEVPPVLLIMCR